MERAGWVLVRSRGELIFKHPKSPVLVRVPNHPGRDLKKGTLKAIVAAAGLTEDQFVRLL